MNQIDLLIIGGGITGSGCLLEATRRGLRSVLVEKGDFSSGTTAASSRLIHGGIRYLEHLHVRLVAESLKERFWISKRFPHLLKPLAIHVPVYGWGKRSPLVAGIGIKLYDLLSGTMKIENSKIHLKKSAREMIPEIHLDGLSGIFVFYDYQIIMPERLVLENIIAARSMGAMALNYNSVREIRHQNGGYRVAVKNTLTGEESSIFAAAVINATGAWADEIRMLAGFGSKLLRPTKGVHIETQRLGDRALFVEAGTDNRLFYMLPFMNHTLIGTTDTDYNESPDLVEPLPEDVSYLIDNANQILNGIRLDRTKVYASFGGLRPLLNIPGKTESDIPRAHRVVCEGPQGRFISIIGGKLTTYRKMAEDTAKKVRKILGVADRARLSAPEFPCGAVASVERERYIEHLAGEYGIEKRTASALFTLYGMGAENVLEYAGNDAALKIPVSECTSEIPAQIVYGFEKEFARKLEDILLRRMLLGKSPSKGLEAGEAIKVALTKFMGKSPDEADDLFDEARQSIIKKFGMNDRITG
ncbi:MAG: FAD-dependent oxidoreductase [Candidatus Latescibacteria bacterium]|nr:FAD-dependent oxidoreductase [Candidatus Latescibacterota bacterium]NIM22193.1 FAD-dependent oxidoreductase [Candidatus Latescibacterota bacterium]NIM66232.1 FAD-dependent oxidoreductase [Candidatus Latescibacterota bacterium]NIO02308.1 FAD-dependent oxidoreductase [Candidatus Latescibacterota bacterium]NIO29839.1 FAD-dependent oxidoreductase [Candidatus Latescibacterota bacterium]